jgi:hypothetical protein
MMAMRILETSRMIDLWCQIKHVYQGLGRASKGWIAVLQNDEFSLGQAGHGQNCQSFVACPFQAGLPQEIRLSPWEETKSTT